MTIILRYAAIALAVLVVAIVLTVCGEGAACSTCEHACCMGSDRLDRLRAIIGRVLGVSGSCCAAVRAAAMSATPHLGFPTAPFVVTAQLAATASPLRI